MGKKLSEKYEIHLSVDTEKSSDQVTVLRVYIADADTGAPNPNMTVWFYEKLTSNLNQLREELEKIEIVSVLINTCTICHKNFCKMEKCRMWASRFWKKAGL